MSDIFIKTNPQGQTGWRKVSNIFVKTNPQGQTGWRQAIAVFLRTAEQWLRVWPISGVYATRTAWIGPDSTTAYADRMPSAASPYIRIGSNYYGNNAQWDPNGFTISSYSYAWKYYSTNDGQSTGITFPGESGTGSGWTAAGSGQDILPTSTWSNSANNDTYDRKYLRFEVTANATNSTYSGFSDSPYIQIVRRIPINTSASISTNTPQVGTAVTYTSNWDTSEARKAESNRTTIVWYTNSTNTASGGTQVGTGSSYTPVSGDVGRFLYVVETRFNSGTDVDLGLTTGVSVSVVSTSTIAEQSFQVTGSQRRITLPSNFTSGTTIYISTNGYINWGGLDPGGSISLPDSGVTISPLNTDLRQGANTGNGVNVSTGGLWTFSDATNFYVRWEGNYYNDSTQLAEYQVKFYWNQSYADVYFINNSITSAVPSTTAVKNGTNIFRTWGQSTSEASTLISTSTMIKNTTNDAVDDGRTAIVALTPPSGSGFAAVDQTASPSPAPSSVSVSGSTSNNATISWTNPTNNLTSISVSYSGAGTTGSPFTDDTSPFATSISRAYTSSATINVTVTATNNNKVARLSWNQSNTASYSITYTVSGLGQFTDNLNTSGSVGSYDVILGSISRTVTFNSITLYSLSNQQGQSITYSPSSVSVTPTDKTSSGTGSGNVTFTQPQYTVTWNATANGGTGGGTTTENAGSAHTAPAASRNSFTVTFNANGGTGSASVSSVTGTSPFIRWADTQGATNGTGDFTVSVAAEGSYTPTSSITLYARWNQGTSNAVTLATVGTLARTGFTFGGWEIGGTNYTAGASFTPTANVTANAIWISNAPSNGSVTVALSSGTAGRVGAVYAVTNASASGTPTPTIDSYQWQRFNLATETWNNVSGATGSSFTIDFSHVGGRFACLVTFTNGVTPNLQTRSNQITIDNPTITSVTSSYFSTAPFVIWRVFGYNMRAITTRTIIQGVTQSDSTTSLSTNNDATNGITRQTNVGGTNQTYALIIRPEQNSGGGGAVGTTVTTNTLTNTLANRNNSPITNTFTATGTV